MNVLNLGREHISCIVARQLYDDNIEQLLMEESNAMEVDEHEEFHLHTDYNLDIEGQEGHPQHEVESTAQGEHEQPERPVGEEITEAASDVVQHIREDVSQHCDILGLSCSEESSNVFEKKNI